MAQQRFSGRALRRRRELLGIKPEALALSARRSAQSIGLYELGYVVPPVDVLTRLADALGCRPGDLFEDTEEADRVAG